MTNQNNFNSRKINAFIKEVYNYLQPKICNNTKLKLIIDWSVAKNICAINDKYAITIYPSNIISNNNNYEDYLYFNLIFTIAHELYHTNQLYDSYYYNYDFKYNNIIEKYANANALNIIKKYTNDLVSITKKYFNYNITDLYYRFNILLSDFICIYNVDINNPPEFYQCSLENLIVRNLNCILAYNNDYINAMPTFTDMIYKKYGTIEMTIFYNNNGVYKLIDTDIILDNKKLNPSILFHYLHLIDNTKYNKVPFSKIVSSFDENNLPKSLILVVINHGSYEMIKLIDKENK